MNARPSFSNIASPSSTVLYHRERISTRSGAVFSTTCASLAGAILPRSRAVGGNLPIAFMSFPPFLNSPDDFTINNDRRTTSIFAATPASRRGFQPPGRSLGWLLNQSMISPPVVSQTFS
jgi:hypothetical protein